MEENLKESKPPMLNFIETDKSTPKSKAHHTKKIKCKRNFPSLRVKIEIIKEIHEKRQSVNDVARKYELGTSTIYSLLKNKERILQFANYDKAEQRKNCRFGSFPNVEKSVYEWVFRQRSLGNEIQKIDVLRSARKIYEDIIEREGVTFNYFKATDGWYRNFKKRFNIKDFNEDVLKPPDELEFLKEIEKKEESPKEKPVSKFEDFDEEADFSPEPVDDTVWLVAADFDTEIKMEQELDNESSDLVSDFHTELKQELCDDEKDDEYSSTQVNYTEALRCIEKAIEFANLQGDDEDAERLSLIHRKWLKREKLYNPKTNKKL